MTQPTRASEPPGGDEVVGRFSELIDEIVEVHHTFARRALPELSALLDRVTVKHGAAHPELLPLEMIFTDFRAELEIHLTREEQGLFVLARELERSGQLKRFQQDSLRNAMRCMAAEHDAALAELEAMRRLTLEFRVPDDGGAEYRALYQMFTELHRDLREHVRKENEVLLPALEDHLDELTR
jgi:regulator of cell morphogenesis and NO signaling